MKYSGKRWRLYREFVHKHNNKLLLFWALTTSLSFGYIYHLQKQGKDFRSNYTLLLLTTPTLVSRDEMLPQYFNSSKEWIQYLGLDKTMDNQGRR